MIATVAIVDDDPAICESATLLFEVAGWIGTSYASPKRFLEDVKAGICPDCAVVDLHMPDMNGAEVFEHLVEHEITLPTILLTWDIKSPLVRRAIDAGVQKVLRKPPDSQRLLDLITSLVTTHGDTRQ